MAEYIDLEEAVKKIRECGVLGAGYSDEERENNVVDMLECLPAADVAPVVHGRWEEADDGDGVVCSICREDFCTIYLETERFNYCPNCGAMMKDGGSDEG